MYISLSKKATRIIVSVITLLVVATSGRIYGVLNENSSIEVSGNWGLSFKEEGNAPIANATSDELEKYDAYYIGDTSDKNIYLTFDAGFENGYTEHILDTLSIHEVPATFFLVGHYLESQPELVQRMVDEGHIVGNHTYSHPDMTTLSEINTFSEQLSSLERLYKDIIGEDMLKVYRPPQGKYNEDNLRLAKQLGYTTFFWSLAYVDWYTDNQPTKQEALEKLIPRMHDGAIVLLHSTSSTNAEILDEFITTLKEEGYSFKPLSELIKSQSVAQ